MHAAMRSIPRLVAGIVALSIGTACGSVESAGSVDLVRYDFDDGLRDDGGALSVADASGNRHDAVARAQNGGDGLLEMVARADGQALSFPAPCEESDPAACPRVIMEAADTSDLNPAQADFALGFDFLVDSADLDPDSDQNAMQKGNFDDPAQWKIEIGAEGRVRCVFRFGPDNLVEPIILQSEGAVTDGAWHTVRCERAGGQLSMAIDGATSSADIPGGAADFSNDRPLIMGGRDIGVQNDQFHGTIDDAYFEMGPVSEAAE